MSICKGFENREDTTPLLANHSKSLDTLLEDYQFSYKRAEEFLEGCSIHITDPEAKKGSWYLSQNSYSKIREVKSLPFNS